MLIGDCAADPPLGATARLLATTRADDVVFGLGALALARGADELALAVADGEARAALAAAIARAAARVQLVDVPDAWPGVTGGPGDTIVPAAALLAIADQARGRPATHWLTVAGAVATPALLAATADETVAALVARAGGALDDDWLAVAGGLPAGRLVARADRLDQLGAPSLLLILPARHELVRRLRTPVAAWLRRAASACEGCRACSDACPAELTPAALVATLASGRDDGAAPAAFAACSGCGLCDSVCPAQLSPRALATAVRDRLHDRGLRVSPPPAARAGLDRALLTARLGLAAYDVTPRRG